MADTLEIFGTEYTGVTGIKATDNNNQTKTYIRPQGNLAIAANTPSQDVTQYATVSVAVPFVTYYTGTSDPSAGTGNNGDIYLKVVS